MSGRIKGYSVVIMSGEAVYVEGVNKYLTLGNEKMEMLAGKKHVIIEGKNMSIEELNAETIIIVGEINCVREEGQCTESQHKD